MLSHMENSISAGLMQQQAAVAQQQGSAPVNIPGSPMNSAMAGLFHGTSAPVNIPGSSLGNFSPTTNNMFAVDPFAPPGHPAHPGQAGPPPQQQQGPHHGHHMSGSAPKIGNGSFGPGDNLFFQSQLISPNLGDPLSSISPDLRMPPGDHHLGSMRDELHSNGLFDNGLGFSKSPCMNPAISELDRLKEELMNKNLQLQHMEQRRKVVEKEFEEISRKVRGGEEEFLGEEIYVNGLLSLCLPVPSLPPRTLRRRSRTLCRAALSGLSPFGGVCV